MLKTLAMSTVLTVSLNYAIAQETTAELLESMGFTKMEIPECYEEQIQRLDKDTSHCDFSYGDKHHSTTINNIQTDESEESYLSREKQDIKLVIRTYKDETGEYVASSIDGDSLHPSISKQLLDLFCVELRKIRLPGEKRIYRAK